MRKKVTPDHVELAAGQAATATSLFTDAQAALVQANATLNEGLEGDLEHHHVVSQRILNARLQLSANARLHAKIGEILA